MTTEAQPVSVKEKSHRMGAMSAPSADLYKGSSVLGLLRTSEGMSQGSNTEPEYAAQEILPPPLNMYEAKRLKDISPHHASCITTKKNCIVGLGFLSNDDLNNNGVVDPSERSAAEMASLLTGAPYIKSNADTVLDKYTMRGFSNELMDWVEDALDTGTGYLEVSRKGDDIVYIGMLPTEAVHVVKQGREIYFRVVEKNGGYVYYSRFGMENKEWLFTKGPYAGSDKDRDTVSELIMLSEPSNRCRYYGYPSWLAAAVDIDLLRKAKQYKADFYHNRGVLDFIFSVTGHNVDDDEWSKITTMISDTSGEGTNWKSLALNFASPDAKIQIDKLASDSGTEEQFANDNEVFSQNIVSAHAVPPLLANILIPGKLGASNEYVNSLIGFQLLRIGPWQQNVQKTLSSTLGNKELNGGLSIGPEDFRLRTITSQINLQALDTIGRMREEVTTDPNRDLNDGVKD